MSVQSAHLEKYINQREQDFPNVVEPLSKSDLTKVTLAVLGKAPETYGSPLILPYHNWEHGQEVVNNVIKLITRLRRHGIQVDPQVVIPAAAGHDAYMHEFSHHKQEFVHPEEFSAAMTYIAARSAGASHKHAYIIAQTILTTCKDFTPETTEQKVLRAADLTGVGEGYRTFDKNFKLIFEEVKLAVPNLSVKDFFDRTVSILGKYGEIEIDLTPEGRDASGRSRWHMALYENILKKAGEIHEQFTTSLRIYDDPTWENSSDAHINLAVGQKTIKLLFPNKTARLLSLPNACIGEANISSENPECIREVGRVLKPGGMAHFQINNRNFDFGKGLIDACEIHGLKLAKTGYLRITQNDDPSQKIFTLIKNPAEKI